MAKGSVQEYSDAELLTELARHKQELFELRFKHATGSLENHSRLGEQRRAIARILTELRDREIAAAEHQGQNS
jgi:large subunit ribosomal protein L29